MKKRILHISDLHGNLKPLHKIANSGEAFDWIVFTGDIAPTHVKYMSIDYKTGHRVIDRPAEAAHQRQWAENALDPLVKRIPHTHSFWVNGNHDFFDAEGLFDYTLTKHSHSLEVDGIKIGMVVGISPLAYEWHEEMPDYDFSGLCDKLPKDIQVLLTHAPASQVLDHNYGGQHIGFNSLYHKLFGSALREEAPRFNSLKLHLFGHAHEAHGEKDIDVEGRNIHFSNAACEPNIIEVDFETAA